MHSVIFEEPNSSTGGISQLFFRGVAIFKGTLPAKRFKYKTSSPLRRKNLKRSFASTGRPTVHINPLHKQSFSETLFKPEEFENAGFSFSCGQKTF